MKSLLILLFFIPVITFSQTERVVKLNEKSAEIIFLRKVEQAVRVHDADQLMTYMEPGYKRSQHDEFLEGRTLQFLTEFFCANVPFDQISSAKLINCVKSKENKNQYDVIFYVSNGKEECTCTFFMIKHPSTNVFTIFSAVG